MGIYFFTKGFLLTRLVLDHQSRCGVTPINDLDVSSSNGSEAGCWHPKTFDRAVVIIVDALRYDFTVPWSSSTGERPPHFRNALTVLYETAVEQPANAFLRPFLADPPTTTLQRLKGLTTGTLPTFVDAGSNFAGTAIEEDNLLAQLRHAGKNLVHLGDDTWHSLFPGYFDAELTKSYDSLNVWDLHTVDNGVTKHLLPLLQPSYSSKWDVIFGHYLGVDHAGHRYGPDHPAMTAKLRQMDAVLRDTIAALDESTLLVVMGDHGMDVKGDHGGESDDEIQAALWMYSKKGIFGRTSPDAVLPPKTAKERPVWQIDLVPTLSLLLGIPIPFNNLGAPIEETFIGRKGDDWANLAAVFRLTGAQVNRYQHEYALARGLPESTMSRPLNLWEQANQKWDDVQRDGSKPSGLGWSEAAGGYAAYQAETLRICKDLWARFDIPNMVEGILLLLASLVLKIAFVIGGSDARKHAYPPSFLRVLGHTVTGSAAGGVLATLLPFSTKPADGAFLGSAIACLASLIARLQPWSGQSYKSKTRLSLWTWIAIVFTLLQSVGLASNSFTIWEDEILLFFISTFGVLAALSSLRRGRRMGVYQSILFMFLARVASLSRLCREEQMPHCRSTYYASASSSTSAPRQLLLPFGLSFLIPYVVKSYYQRTRSYDGPAPIWISIAVRTCMLLAAVFWTLDAADDGDWFGFQQGILKSIRVLIAQSIFGISLVAGTVMYIWGKPCVGTEAGSEPIACIDASSRLLSRNPTSKTVLNYSNLHGTRYFLLVINWFVALVLLQKPMGHLSLGILIWQILCLLEILHANSLTSSVIGPVMLGLLGNYHFFKTGHQATLSSIQWETAFIPLHQIRYPWSPLLVVGNTFAAQILCTLAVPLVALWNRPLTRSTTLLRDVGRALSTYLVYHAVVNLATTVFAAWLRRHLMLYRIFSPRWMTGATVLLVCDLVGILVAGMGVRWSTLSVARIFGWGTRDR